MSHPQKCRYMINFASAQELRSIPGLGEKSVQAIVRVRLHEDITVDSFQDILRALKIKPTKEMFDMLDFRACEPSRVESARNTSTPRSDAPLRSILKKEVEDLERQFEQGAIPKNPTGSRPGEQHSRLAGYMTFQAAQNTPEKEGIAEFERRQSRGRPVLETTGDRVSSTGRAEELQDLESQTRREGARRIPREALRGGDSEEDEETSRTLKRLDTLLSKLDINLDSRSATADASRQAATRRSAEAQQNSERPYVSSRTRSWRNPEDIFPQEDSGRRGRGEGYASRQRK